MSSTPRQRKKQGPFAFVRRRPRFNACVVLFVVLIGICYACGVGPARAILLAFVVAASVFVVLAAFMFGRADAASIRSRAREEDQGRWGALWSSVVVAGVVLVALGLELHASQAGSVFEIALAATTLLLSWIFMNTMFAIHYAHSFYGDDAHKRKRGGLDFPGEGDADYWDFVYFAFVIGMTFQVSDVQVSDRRLRRIVLAHGVIAFFFNVVIIALSVNVVAGKA